MSRDEILLELIDIMKEVGMYIDLEKDINLEKEDIDVRKYIRDSFQFISFIVEVEEKFGVSLPDQFIVIENFSSLKSMAIIIEELLKEG